MEQLNEVGLAYPDDITMVSLLLLITLQKMPNYYHLMYVCL